VKVYVLSDSGVWVDKGTGYLITEIRINHPLSKLIDESPLEPMNNSTVLPVQQQTVPGGSISSREYIDQRHNTSPVSSENNCEPRSTATDAQIPLHTPAVGSKIVVVPQVNYVDFSAQGNSIIGPKLPPDSQLPVQTTLVFKVKAEGSDQILVPETDTSRIQFEKQGGTILTWEDNQEEAEVDLALSFQREDDFNHIWDLIGLHKEQPAHSGPVVSGDFTINLPPPNMTNIIEVVDFVCHHGELHKDHIISHACTDQ